MFRIVVVEDDELENYHGMVDSGSKVLDAILESKLITAKKYHIEMNLCHSRKASGFSAGNGSLYDFRKCVGQCD